MRGPDKNGYFGENFRRPFHRGRSNSQTTRFACQNVSCMVDGYIMGKMHFLPVQPRT